MSLALAAAYLLVLQMVVVGFTLGAQAAPAATDLHEILCTTSGDHDGGGSDGSLPGHLDCCTQGCPMLGSLGIPAPVAVDVPAMAFVPAPEPLPPSFHCPNQGPRQDQRTARGPPRVG